MADVIATVGKNKVAEMIGGIGANEGFDQLALGTGTTTATASQTALVTELTGSGLAKATATTTTATANILQLQHTWTSTGTKAITECGVFNSHTATDGSMLARSNFAAINVVSDDSLQITYKVTVS
jgi:hypothetical protein